MFTDSDRRQLEQAGIATAEAGRQLALLGGPARYVRLVRPCTVGDGIERIELESRPALAARHDEAARAGRCSKLIPASGAATRMFRDLLYYQRGRGRECTWSEIRREAGEGRAEAATLVEFLTRVGEFAFYERLRRTLFRDGESLEGLVRLGAFQPVLDALLGAEGMDYASLPKGLLEFHAYAEGPRTAFEEHLVEAVDCVRDASGQCRVHFTVSPEHRAAFERLLAQVGSKYELRTGAQLDVGWSVQKPATDTLAVEASGEPLRDANGRLRLRPGGHGALIDNLNDLGADVVFIKNIDNVQPDRTRAVASEWKRLLCGRLLGVQDEGLDRPSRVCGVVRNTGEPGGGPFWVRAADGTTSRQIVESAQVDPDDPGQAAIFASSTHFNPVDLVCSLRDASGRPYALGEFVDQDAVILTRKTEGGREVRALERPGLWNGAMAHWNTVFVEVPNETFTPVKTVLDLLRPEHVARGGG